MVGQAYVAREAGFGKAIGFDMGGTSTDVSRFDGDFEHRLEMEVSDPDTDTQVRIVAPMLAIETVAAGGGSICGFDGQKPVVGPRSAGADPGPACYGRGGPLCVTDVNLYLGRLLAGRFAFPLDRGAVEARLSELLDRIAAATGQRYRREDLVITVEELKDIVADHGMDPGKLVMKWKSPDRIIDRIVEISVGRTRKGDAFRS